MCICIVIIVLILAVCETGVMLQLIIYYFIIVVIDQIIIIKIGKNDEKINFNRPSIVPALIKLEPSYNASLN